MSEPGDADASSSADFMLEVAGIGAWCLEISGDRTSLSWSRLTKDIHEVAPDYEPNLTDALAFYPPEARAVLEPAIAAAVRDGRAWDLELPLVTAKGRRIWTRARGRVLARDAATVRLVGTFEDITARRQHALELERLTVVVRQMTNAAILTDREGRTQWVNAAFTRLTGYTLEEMAGRKPGELLQGPDTNRAEVARVSAAIRAGEAVEAELLNYHRDGTPYWIAVVISPVRNAAGELTGFVAIESDVTARRRAEAAAARELERRAAAETLLLDVIDSLPSAVIAYDADERFLLANRAYAAMFPALRPHLVPGATLRDIHAAKLATGLYVHEIAPDATEEEKQAWLDRWLASIRAAGASRVFRNHDGRWLQARERRSESGTLVCVRTDITRLKRAEQRSRRRAEQDELTGLANRSLLFSRLADHTRMRRSRDAGCCLITFDIDHFKSINDSLGHDAGDRLLKTVARRLARVVRSTDTVARLGGDEFAVILPDVVTAQAAQRFLSRLTSAVVKPVTIASRAVPLSLSLGAAFFPMDADTPDALYRAADSALYEAKRQGRGRWAFFDGSLKAMLERQAKLSDQLRSAIVEGRIGIKLQPQMRLSDGTHVGFEVLARWECDDESIGPSEFIAVAEETGLIVPLGALVLRSALGTVRRMLDRGLDPGRIAVNVAAAQLLAPDFVTSVRGLCGEIGVGTERLEIEVTETVLLDRSTDRIAQVLAELRALGVVIALDDFGTGYASLSHLQRFPVQRLKIDKRFVADIGSETAHALIARTVISLARGLKMESVAEGVETVAQARQLEALGCDIGQGYLISPPLSSDAAIRWLETARTAATVRPRAAATRASRRARHRSNGAAETVPLEAGHAGSP
jgi:diguanylate cyclase (GGDEF)-like protein/PAS domain S-box-containing protein